MTVARNGVAGKIRRAMGPLVYGRRFTGIEQRFIASVLPSPAAPRTMTCESFRNPDS